MSGNGGIASEAKENHEEHEDQHRPFFVPILDGTRGEGSREGTDWGTNRLPSVRSTRPAGSSREWRVGSMAALIRVTV